MTSSTPTSSSTKRRTQPYARRTRPARAPKRGVRSRFAAWRPPDLLRGLLRGLFLVQPRQARLELLQFRQIVENDVGLIGMQLKVVLVLAFGGGKPRNGNHLVHYRFGEAIVWIKLRYCGGCTS